MLHRKIMLWAGSGYVNAWLELGWCLRSGCGTNSSAEADVPCLSVDDGLRTADGQIHALAALPVLVGVVHTSQEAANAAHEATRLAERLYVGLDDQLTQQLRVVGVFVDGFQHL